MIEMFVFLFSNMMQLQVARVTAKFVSLDEDARRELRSEGAIRLLVSLLMDQTKSEVKEPELDELKVEAAHLLWKIAAGNVNTCKLITDTCELQCFANLMEHSRGELKYYSVMIVMEIAAAAKSDSEFGYSTFTTNSHSAKAVVEMLLAEIKSEKGEPRLQVCGALIYTSATLTSISILILCEVPISRIDEKSHAIVFMEENKSKVTFPWQFKPDFL